MMTLHVKGRIIPPFIFAFILTWSSVISTNSTDVELVARQVRSSQANNNNIAFDLPDLTATVETLQGVNQIEAFKSVNNDKILREAGVPRASELIWVSVGQPELIRTPSRADSKKRVFHSSKYGFYTYIHMLTAVQRKLLASTASAKYRTRVGEAQIVNLILSKFECSILFYDDTGNKYLIKGEVANFRTFPLRMDFVAPISTVERKLFKENVNSSEDFYHLQLSCEMASSGKVIFTNILSISAEQTQQIGLGEKLFGPSSKGKDTVYVTRDQTSLLASEMYSKLNIIEDYEMPETKFSEAFVEGFINQVATKSFTMEPVDSVLKTLSTYGFDTADDLKPDIIKRDMGQIFKVEERDSKKRIVLNESNYKKFVGTYKQSVGASVGGSYGLFGLQVSANWAKENSKNREAKQKSLHDQLTALNTVIKNDIKWEIEGERVVPKSLNVAKLSRSNMAKTLRFSRVRIQKVDAPFNREFKLYTYRSNASTPVADAINSRVDLLVAQLDAVSSSLTSQLAKQNKTLSSSINAVSSQLTSLSKVALIRCRICFRQDEGSPPCQSSSSYLLTTAQCKILQDKYS